MRDVGVCAAGSGAQRVVSGPVAAPTRSVGVARSVAWANRTVYIFMGIHDIRTSAELKKTGRRRHPRARHANENNS